MKSFICRDPQSEKSFSDLFFDRRSWHKFFFAIDLTIGAGPAPEQKKIGSNLKKFNKSFFFTRSSELACFFPSPEKPKIMLLNFFSYKKINSPLKKSRNKNRKQLLLLRNFFQKTFVV
jgi:hypothetical protein